MFYIVYSNLLPIGILFVFFIRYYFANQSKVTTTTAGENILVNIIGTLFDAIENDHGTLPTRLYRAFTPKFG